MVNVNTTFYKNEKISKKKEKKKKREREN